jgi:predicted secreted protein
MMDRNREPAMRTRLALALIALALPAAAQTPTSPPRDADGFTVVELSESAQRDVPRDRMRVTLRIEEAGPDAASVQAAVNKRAAAAVERARAATGVRVETGGYWVNEERPKSGPARWRGHQTLTLITGNPSAALPVAGELQQAGLLAAGVAWELTPGAVRQIEDELTTEALHRLRERAQLVAREMSLTVVRFNQLTVGQAAREAPRPMPMAVAGGPPAPAAPSMVAEAGVQTVVVNVQAEVLLKPK